MKRILAFVALFALGLAVLLFVQRRLEKEKPREVEQTPPPVVPGPPIEVPVGHGDALVRSGGAFSDIRRDPATERQRFLFEAENHRPSPDGTVAFEKAKAALFDNGEKTSELHAARATGKLRTSPSPGLDESVPVGMDEVEIVLHAGVPLVPVTLRVPHLDARFDELHFTSNDHVDVEGRALNGGGEGLDIDARAQSLRLLRDPCITLDLQPGESATLCSHGELRLRKVLESSEGEVELAASDGAKLDVLGERPLALEAQSVVLTGKPVHEEDAERFQPTRATAEGGVRLRPADGVFAGDRATLEFEGSRPARAKLEGHPTIELRLRDVARAGLPAKVPLEGDTLPVDASGAGPLTLELGPSPSFEFAGPAQLALASLGATLSTEGRITGKHAPGEGFSTLHAERKAKLVYQGATLETEDLDLGTFVAWNEQRAARLEAHGPSRTTGTLPDGRAFTLTTRDGLVYVQSGDSFRIPEGRGVELKVEGEHGFLARADSVRDFDGRDLSFVAEGHVFFEDQRGRGTGERLEAHGARNAELFGGEGEPARFELESGSLSAGSIEWREQHFGAREGVHAELALGGETYEIDSRWLDVERGAQLEGESAPQDVTLDAGGDVRVKLDGPLRKLRLESQLFRARGKQQGSGEQLSAFSAETVQASGGVHFESTGALQLAGEAERIELAADGSGRILPAAGERAHVAGSLPSENLRFEMTSGPLEFSRTLLTAEAPDIELRGVALPLAPEAGASAQETTSRVRAIAGRMTCDPHSVLFSQRAYLGRVGENQQSWSIDADKALLTTAPAADQPGAGAAGATPAPTTQIQNLFAWGGFVARFGSGVLGSGEYLEILRSTSLMTMTGAPAQLLTPGATWKANEFELNLVTGFLRASQGELRSSKADGRPGWSLRYTSLEPVETPDETIQVVREPVLTSGDREVRAAWALFWVDKQEWARVTGRAMGAPEAPEPPPIEVASNAQRRMTTLFGELDAGEIGRWLREFYLEGNIEYAIAGDRKARADAIYLDLVQGHGWVSKFDMAIDFPPLQQRQQPRPLRLKLRAEWLRLSADGTFRASSAEATTCEFEEPHYVIEIGDLRFTPRMKPRALRPGEQPGPQPPTEPDGWDVAAHDTSILVGHAFSLPLPRIDFPVTPTYQIDRENFRLLGVNPAQFGNDSKFGTFFRAQFTLPLGWIAHAFDALLSGHMPAWRYDPNTPNLKGETTSKAAWLGSRGVLLGLTTDIEHVGRYKFTFDIDGLLDRGDDKGLVRVPKDDRSDLRLWTHGRGRYFLDKNEWIDLVFTRQSDPGVQSEFFENQYLRFEERESYLHWRRADGDRYLRATAEARLEDFRTDVVEEPSFEFFRGRSRIGSLGKAPLLYTSDATAGYYLRREGDPQFEPPFPDGLGERDVLRVATDQRLESPFPLGALGLRATPFVEVNAAAWDEGADPDQSPARAALLTGATLSTTFWRLFKGGSLHEWSPSVGVRGDLAVENTGGAPVPIDMTEDPLEGRFVDLALRSRWSHPERKSHFDLELRESYGRDLPAGAPDGWQPLVTRGSWLSYVLGMPVGATHESRYDVDNSETQYSRTFFGWEPIPPLEFEAGYHSARDLAGAPLYDAYSFGARYTFSPKWELEGRETISTLGEGRLASEVVVRRVGHDFVFEVETGFTAGEGGGGSLRFNIAPLLVWRHSRFGLLDRWRDQNE